MEDRPRDRAHDAHSALQLREHRRRAVRRAAGSRGEAFADLALDHRHPALHARQLVDRAQEHARCDPVGEIRDQHPRRGLEARQRDPHRIAPVHTHVLALAQRVAERVAQALVDLDDVDMRDAVGEVLREHAQAAADL